MIRTDVIIILQARMASTRLPGKALEPLAGRTLIGRCLDRLTAAGVAPVMLATTRHREDDPLVEEAARSGALTFRGPDDNVLRRFVAAARSVHARFVVRATADNPAVDIDAAARVLEAITTTGADHAMDVGLPIGCAVEAITVRALRRALELTADPYDLEHVTPFIRRDNHRFHVVETPAPARVRRPDLRLTIDTPSDLQFMRQVLNRIGSSVPERPLALIIEVADHVSTGAVAS